MKSTKDTLAGLRPVAIILASLFAATAAQAQQEDGSLPFAVGKEANASYGSVAVGNYVGADNRSVAVGVASSAKSDSVAIGFDANAANHNNIAVGSWAKASGVNGIAIGSQTTASATNSVALGVKSVADRDNTISVGAGRAERQIVNVRAGTEATDAVNLAQLDEKIQASNNRTDDQLRAEQKQREAGDVQTLNNAKEYTDGREKVISAKINTVESSLNDTIVAQVNSEAIARNQAIATASQGVNDRTDGLIAKEQQERNSAINTVKGEANRYADAQVSSSNQRTDGLIKTEQAARVKGNADTLASAKAHSDENDVRTLAAANAHTDSSVSAGNQRTDGLIAKEQQDRAEGDARTLKSANHYTDWRVENLNVEVSAEALKKSQTYTDRRFGEAKAYTDSKFGQLSNKIERAEKRLNAGIAGVTAISSIPYVAENDFSYGVALGNYRNGNALAGGIQKKLSPNTNVRLNVSWDSSSNAALGVGFAGGW